MEERQTPRRSQSQTRISKERETLLSQNHYNQLLRKCKDLAKKPNFKKLRVIVQANRKEINDDSDSESEDDSEISSYEFRKIQFFPLEKYFEATSISYRFNQDEDLVILLKGTTSQYLSTKWLSLKIDPNLPNSVQAALEEVPSELNFEAKERVYSKHGLRVISLLIDGAFVFMMENLRVRYNPPRRPFGEVSILGWDQNLWKFYTRDQESIFFYSLKENGMKKEFKIKKFLSEKRWRGSKNRPKKANKTHGYDHLSFKYLPSGGYDQSSDRLLCLAVKYKRIAHGENQRVVSHARLYLFNFSKIEKEGVFLEEMCVSETNVLKSLKFSIDPNMDFEEISQDLLVTPQSDTIGIAMTQKLLYKVDLYPDDQDFVNFENEEKEPFSVNKEVLHLALFGMSDDKLEIKSRSSISYNLDRGKFEGDSSPKDLLLACSEDESLYYSISPSSSNFIHIHQSHDFISCDAKKAANINKKKVLIELNPVNNWQEAFDQGFEAYSKILKIRRSEAVLTLFSRSNVKIIETGIIAYQGELKNGQFSFDNLKDSDQIQFHLAEALGEGDVGNRLLLPEKRENDPESHRPLKYYWSKKQKSARAVVPNYNPRENEFSLKIFNFNKSPVLLAEIRKREIESRIGKNERYRDVRSFENVNFTIIPESRNDVGNPAEQFHASKKFNTVVFTGLRAVNQRSERFNSKNSELCVLFIFKKTQKSRSSRSASQRGSADSQESSSESSEIENQKFGFELQEDPVFYQGDYRDVKIWFPPDKTNKRAKEKPESKNKKEGKEHKRFFMLAKNSSRNPTGVNLFVVNIDPEDDPESSMSQSQSKMLDQKLRLLEPQMYFEASAELSSLHLPLKVDFDVYRSSTQLLIQTGAVIEEDQSKKYSLQALDVWEIDSSIKQILREKATKSKKIEKKSQKKAKKLNSCPKTQILYKKSDCLDLDLSRFHIIKELSLILLGPFSYARIQNSQSSAGPEFSYQKVQREPRFERTIRSQLSDNNSYVLLVSEEKENKNNFCYTIWKRGGKLRLCLSFEIEKDSPIFYTMDESLRSLVFVNKKGWPVKLKVKEKTDSESLTVSKRYLEGFLGCLDDICEEKSVVGVAQDAEALTESVQSLARNKAIQGTRFDRLAYLREIHVVHNLLYVLVVLKQSSLLKCSLQRIGFYPYLYSKKMNPLMAAVEINDSATLVVFAEYLRSSTWENLDILTPLFRMIPFHKIMLTSSPELQGLLLENFFEVTKKQNREDCLKFSNNGREAAAPKAEFYPLESDHSSEALLTFGSFLTPEEERTVEETENRAVLEGKEVIPVSRQVTRTCFSSSIRHKSCRMLLEVANRVSEQNLMTYFAPIISFLWRQNKWSWVLFFFSIESVFLISNLAYVLFFPTITWVFLLAISTTTIQLIIQLVSITLSKHGDGLSLERSFLVALYLALYLVSYLLFSSDLTQQNLALNFFISILVVIMGLRLVYLLSLFDSLRYFNSAILSVFGKLLAFIGLVVLIIVVFTFTGLYMIREAIDKYKGLTSFGAIGRLRYQFYFYYNYLFYGWEKFVKSDLLDDYEFTLYLLASVFLALFIGSLFLALVFKNFMKFNARRRVADIKLKLKILTQFASILSFFEGGDTGSFSNSDFKSMNHVYLITPSDNDFGWKVKEIDV